MKLLLLNHIQNAHDSLRANRMRTFLTITGVAIGVASIVTILSLAHGAGSIVTNQVDELGGNIAVVRPGASSANTFTSIANQQANGSHAVSTLTLDDVTQIAAIEHVKAVAPLMLLPGTIQADTVAPSGSSIVGSTNDLLAMSGLNLSAGTFDESNPDLVVIGPQLSIDIFGTEASIGKLVTIRNLPLRVSGVLERQATPVNFNGVDFNSAAILSLAKARELLPAAQVQQINIQADSITNLESVIVATNKALLASHAGEEDFSVLSGNEIAQPTSQLFFTIAGVTAAIAGISLLVGGIGIMNIMLVNVAERTREIGIRKALGATSGDIVWQFVIESVIMGLLGGLVGTLLGMALAFCISLFLTFDPYITWQTVAIGFGVSTIVGGIFGLYPAYRAASKNPIESLRQQS